MNKKQIIQIIRTALRDGASLKAACEAVWIDVETFQENYLKDYLRILPLEELDRLEKALGITT